MRRLTSFYAVAILITIALKVTIFQKAHAWKLEFNWDRMLYDNRIDPEKVRRFFGMDPKQKDKK